MRKTCFNCGEVLTEDYFDVCQRCLKKVLTLGDKKAVVKN